MVTVRRLQAVIESNGVSRFSRDMKKAKTSLMSFKGAVGLTGGALAAMGVGGFAVAINEARKFQTALVELEKVTDPQTTREMSDSIMEMAETIPLAQTELADIAAAAGRFGIRGSENITQFTESVSKMATATNLSAAEAGQAFAKLAQLTNTPISEVENLGSAINALSNNFATSSSEIIDAMLRSSAAMAQFGFNQTEIAAVNAALNEVSDSSERAGSRLRRLFQEIIEPKKIADLARALGLTVEEYKAMQETSPVGLLRRMVNRFKEGGTAADTLNSTLSTTSRQALAGLAQNIDGLNQGLALSREEFDKNTSLQKEFEAASKTLDNQLQLLVNSMRNSAITLGMELIPHVTNLVKWVNDGSGAVAKLNQRFDGMLIPATLAASVIVGLSAAIYGLSGAITAAKLAAFASGVATVGVALVGVTAILVGLGMAWKNNWFGIRDTTYSVIDSITGFLDTLTAEFRDTIDQFAGDAQEFFGTLNLIVRNGLALLRAIWDGDTALIKQSWGMLMESLRVATKQGIELLRNVFVWGINDIIQAASAHFDWFPTEWANMFADITNAVVSGTSAILLDMLGFKTESKDMWQTTMAAWDNAVNLYWPKVKQDITGGLNGLKQGLINAGKRYVTIWKGLWGLFPQPVRDAFTRVVTTFTQVRDKAVQTFTQIRNKILGKSNQIRQDTTSTWNSIRNKINQVTSFIQNTIIGPFTNWMEQQWNEHGTVVLNELRLTVDAWIYQFNRAKRAIMKVITPFLNWATRTWNSTMNEIRKITISVWNSIRKEFNRIRDFLNKTLGKIAEDFMFHWNRLEKDVQRFIDWFTGATRETLNFLQNQWDKHGDEIMSIVSFFVDGIKGTVEFGFNALRTLAVVILRGLRGDVKGVWKEIDRFIKSTLNGLSGFLDRWGGRAKQWATGTFNAAKRNAVGAMNGMKRDVKNTVSSMLSDVKRTASNWVSGFTKPFRDAKERVIKEFNALKRKVVGNSIVPDMLSDIMVEVGKDWNPAFQSEFQDAASGAESAMEGLPEEIGLPTPSSGGSSSKQVVHNYKFDVTVPKGVDVDTAARTITDEFKSRNFN